MSEEIDKQRGPDPVAEAILALIAERGKSVSVEEAAHAFAKRQWKPVEPPPGEWRQYLTAVKQQALFLARAGRIEILRKGKPADPERPIKGVVRYGPAPKPAAN